MTGIRDGSPVLGGTGSSSTRVPSANAGLEFYEVHARASKAGRSAAGRRHGPSAANRRA
jgi:hypothetical protein